MFCIRDVSIRLLLLSHFNSFVHAFEMEELKNHILPELLVGIKDTNDDLVRATLRALADVIPILGAAAVIGGNRGKLFTDGRPNKAMVRNESLDDIKKALTRETSPIFTNMDESNDVRLSERPSPDGGEDKRGKELAFGEEECTWSDWETQESIGSNQCRVTRAEAPTDTAQAPVSPNDVDVTATPALAAESLSSTMKTRYIKKLVLSDITELDIKNFRATKSPKEEFNFFTDMEPVIRKTQILHIPEVHSAKNIFDVKVTNATTSEEHDDNGWGEDLSDLSIDDAHESMEQFTAP